MRLKYKSRYIHEKIISTRSDTDIGNYKIIISGIQNKNNPEYVRNT